MCSRFQKVDDDIFKVDILHEMMHIAGFRHEFAITDTLQHMAHMEIDNQEIVDIGNYDYCSIMQYPSYCSSSDKTRKALNKKLEIMSKDSRDKTFSAHDLAAIKIIYGDKYSHHGIWHKACGSKCSKSKCECGICGPLGSGANCGYSGIKGHYTCCLSENKNSNCETNHTGFWHAKCSV